MGLSFGRLRLMRFVSPPGLQRKEQSPIENQPTRERTEGEGEGEEWKQTKLEKINSQAKRSQNRDRVTPRFFRILVQLTPRSRYFFPVDTFRPENVRNRTVQILCLSGEWTIVTDGECRIAVSYLTGFQRQRHKI